MTVHPLATHIDIADLLDSRSRSGKLCGFDGAPSTVEVSDIVDDLDVDEVPVLDVPHLGEPAWVFNQSDLGWPRPALPAWRRLRDWGRASHIISVPQ